MKLSHETLSKATVKVEEPQPWLRVFEISLPSGEVDRLRSAYLRGFARDMAVPGFRKGKVPAQIVLQRYGSELEARFIEELVEAFIDHQASTEHWPLTRTPRLTSSATAGDSRVFKAEVEIVPRFDLPPYRGLPARISRRTVTDDQVDDFIRRAVRDASRLLPKAGPLALGDAARIRLQRVTSSGVPLVGEGAAELLVMMESSETPDELLEALEGRSTGDTIRVRVPSQRRGLVRHLPGSEDGETYSVTVLEAFSAEAPSMEVIARRFGVDDPSELPTRVRVLLEDALDREARAALRAELLSRVTRSAVIHLPPALVEARLEETRLSLLEEAKAQGHEPSADLLDPQFFAERHRETVRQSIKEVLVVEAIAAEVGLEPTDEQIDAVVETRAIRAGISKRQMLKRLGEEGLAGIARRIMRENVERFLEDEAEVDLEDTREKE